MIMKESSFCNIISLILLSSQSINSFLFHLPNSNELTFSKVKKSTSLNAIGVLARKAKEASIQKEKSLGNLPSEVQSNLQILSSASSLSSPNKLQPNLTKRRGTITIIAEYKRKLDKGGFIDDTLDPDLLSASFREFGATGMAIMADERMGGCTYEDITLVKKENDLHKGDVPGPLLLINSDLIVDELQLAQSAALGVDAVLLAYDALGSYERVQELTQGAYSLGLDVILSVSSKEQIEKVVESGLIKNILVINDDLDDKIDLRSVIPSDLCTIAMIYTSNSSNLEEVEEAWVLRDKGFNAIWASDCLYKYGQDEGEHPGAIIRSMKSKSSVKYASPKAMSGKGEGAREYLGDIMM